MRILKEVSLSDFEWYGGAYFHAQQFTYDELQQLDEILDDDGFPFMDEEKLNDLMWFEPEYLASLIGLEWDEDKDEVIREDEEEE